MSQNVTFFQIVGTNLRLPSMFGSGSERLSASTQKRRNTLRFRTLLFGKETVKEFFYTCSNPGRNESTPQTQNNVSWISSKAELEISFLNSLLEMRVWESGPKIDRVTSVMWRSAA